MRKGKRLSNVVVDESCHDGAVGKAMNLYSGLCASGPLQSKRGTVSHLFAASRVSSLSFTYAAYQYFLDIVAQWRSGSKTRYLRSSPRISHTPTFQMLLSGKYPPYGSLLKFFRLAVTISHGRYTRIEINALPIILKGMRLGYSSFFDRVHVLLLLLFHAFVHHQNNRIDGEAHL